MKEFRMKKRCFAAVLALFVAVVVLGAQEDETKELEHRRNRFIDEGFGFQYVDEELTNYELFLLRHPNPVKISEYDLGTELSDKDIVLEYDSITVKFMTCEYGIYGTEYQTLLWNIESKDKIPYLYGIRHGMTFDELKEIIGEIWFEESGDVILENEKNHFVNISFRFPEGTIEQVVWLIGWFKE
jgi:hypothetical protein